VLYFQQFPRVSPQFFFFSFADLQNNSAKEELRLLLYRKDAVDFYWVWSLFSRRLWVGLARPIEATRTFLVKKAVNMPFSTH
jgi:hypothetical protein